MKKCGDIFITCAVLHNMMLSEMVREGKPPRLERGRHLVSNCMWLEGPSEMLPVPGSVRANRLKEVFINDGCYFLITLKFGGKRINELKIAHLIYHYTPIYLYSSWTFCSISAFRIDRILFTRLTASIIYAASTATQF
jgi:hypothetical protein